jgi:putative PIN family toxin of toxin-antitoxin system
MRLVLDTSVLVAAIRSDAGASRRLLVDALEGRVTVLASVPLFFEYEASMTRAEHLRASRLSVADVNILLDAVAEVATPVRLSFRWRPFLRDPDDDMVLETAVNGQADGIVTFNVRDFWAVPEMFGIFVQRPRETVIRLEENA